MSAAHTLLVYGNCQAEAVSVILRLDPTIAADFDVRYVPSYENRRFESLELTKADLANCALLLEQHDSNPFPERAALPASCGTIKFPSIDCNILWPMNATNPYNPDEPSFPFGRFPYGDRVIITQIDAAKPAADILDYYLNAWDDYKPDLDRLLDLEIARFSARDAKCDVTMGNFFFERFRTERPLWTINHPTQHFLKELVERIVAKASLLDARLRKADVGQTVDNNFLLSPRGPLGIVSVPIHPGVAEHFQLEWYDPQERYYLFDGTDFGYEDYFKELIERSIDAKNAGRQGGSLN